MPRKNNTKPHTYYHYQQPSQQKKRYATKKLALDAAERQMLLQPALSLYVYQEIDGGWYLTRKQIQP